MRNLPFALVIAAALAAPGLAAAQQVDFFRIQMSGLEHCADFDNFKFGSKNSPPMFVRIVDHQEWDLATDDIFTDKIQLIGETYLTSSRKKSFTGGQFGNTFFIAVDGTISLDKNGVPAKISGTFILQTPDNQDPNNPSPPLCNQSGKFKTLERVLQQP